MLTFADRVAYQRVIEEVYWHHRIWPKENAPPKPPLDEVMSQAQGRDRAPGCGERHAAQQVSQRAPQSRGTGKTIVELKSGMTALAAT